MSIRKFLISNLLLTLAITVALALISEYYLLQKEMHFCSLLIVALLFPVSGGIAFLIIQKALDSLKKITQEVSNRELSYLEPVSLSKVPREIRPLIREINQLLFRLKQGLEREKRFAADAAHELRTPLAALKTQAQVALQAEDSETRKLALQHVIEGVDRSTHLVQQLLILSRLVAQADLPAEVSEVSLQKLATEVVANMAPRAIEKQIDIELLPEKGDGTIMGNAKALKALIFNLVDNAIRYNVSGGSIFVSVENIITENKKEHVIFKVSDTGQGIPEEFRDRLFERFFRVLGNDTPGSGLGFAIVEQVVKLHHAEVNIMTPTLGRGLEVKVIFSKERELD